ncbi:hypothetical protein EV426DRAFT_707957 [Tirmania nivea]|nr:hypothetical protein EV426DRAFT_707957 [Tirmania nivea]
MKDRNYLQRAVGTFFQLRNYEELFLISPQTVDFRTPGSIRKVDSPACPNCDHPSEDGFHITFDCPKHHQQRQELIWDARTWEDLDTPIWKKEEGGGGVGCGGGILHLPLPPPCRTLGKATRHNVDAGKTWEELDTPIWRKEEGEEEEWNAVEAYFAYLYRPLTGS